MAHSSYTGAIPKAAAVRGIRARLGNIQIGDESVFDHLFHEDRFNRWCVGEVHILDPHIIPNGRRDYFEPGPHLRNLENHLGPFFRTLSNRCRNSSASRNREKKLLGDISRLEETHFLAKTGYLSTEATFDLVKDALQREAIVRDKMVTAGASPTQLERLDQIKDQLSNLEHHVPAPAYAGMSVPEADAYRKVFKELVKAAPSVSAALQMIENVMTATSE